MFLQSHKGIFKHISIFSNAYRLTKVRIWQSLEKNLTHIGFEPPRFKTPDLVIQIWILLLSRRAWVNSLLHENHRGKILQFYLNCTETKASKNPATPTWPSSIWIKPTLKGKDKKEKAISYKITFVYSNKWLKTENTKVIY